MIRFREHSKKRKKKIISNAVCSFGDSRLQGIKTYSKEIINSVNNIDALYSIWCRWLLCHKSCLFHCQWVLFSSITSIACFTFKIYVVKPMYSNQVVKFSVTINSIFQLQMILVHLNDFIVFFFVFYYLNVKGVFILHALFDSVLFFRSRCYFWRTFEITYWTQVVS